MMGSIIVLHLLWCMQLMFKAYLWLSVQEACSNPILLLSIILEIKCWQMSMLLGWLLSDMFLKPLWVSIRKRKPNFNPTMWMSYWPSVPQWTEEKIKVKWEIPQNWRCRKEGRLSSRKERPNQTDWQRRMWLSRLVPRSGGLSGCLGAADIWDV